jgi:plasmid stability protein
MLRCQCTGPGYALATPKSRIHLTPRGGTGSIGDRMAEVKIRKLDDDVVKALRTRAEERGVSLEEEARRTLRDSVVEKLEAFARRAAASRAATRRPNGKKASDSAILIRKDRDAWG